MMSRRFLLPQKRRRARLGRRARWTRVSSVRPLKQHLRWLPNRAPPSVTLGSLNNRLMMTTYRRFHLHPVVCLTMLDHYVRSCTTNIRVLYYQALLLPLPHQRPFLARKLVMPVMMPPPLLYMRQTLHLTMSLLRIPRQTPFQMRKICNFQVYSIQYITLLNANVRRRHS